MDDILGIFAFWPPAWIALVATIGSIVYFVRRPDTGRKIFIGSVILIIFLVLDAKWSLLGGELWTPVLASIVCAGGIGLLPFYLVAFLIGSIIVRIGIRADLLKQLPVGKSGT